jgi:hypothetical protein
MTKQTKHWRNFTAALLLSWLVGAGTVTIYLFQYAVEDFSIGDLIPFFGALFIFGALLSLFSTAVLLFLSKKIKGLPALITLPLMSIVSITSPVAVYTGLRAFAFQNLPIVEFILLTAAFFTLSFTFGLVFLWFYGESRFRRWLPTLTYAVLAIGLMVVVPNLIPLVGEALLSNQANGVVISSVQMSEPRSAHTATLLKDGRILLTGGMVSVIGQELPTASTEIFDQQTGTILPGAKMSVPRAGHTATLLADGDVLITGGINEREPVASAELYRAATGDFVAVGSMQITRERHSASLLQNGQVLITGGTIVRPSEQAELYDSQTQSFRQISPMNARRAAQTSTLLPDGRVLIAGGAESFESVLQSVEIYDPRDESFKAAGQMQTRRFKHSAVLLDDGKVLLLGGADEREWTGRRNSVELYDPLKNSSQIVSNLNRARFKFPNAVVLSNNGEIIVGGSGRRVEVFDRASGDFKVSAGSLEDEWFYATATPLPDGRVFIAGGYNDSFMSTPQTWLYQPPPGITSMNSLTLLKP